jgi:hypothetical protein
MIFFCVSRMNVQKKFAANIELMTFGALQLLEHKQVFYQFLLILYLH